MTAVILTLLGSLVGYILYLTSKVSGLETAKNQALIKTALENALAKSKEVDNEVQNAVRDYRAERDAYLASQSLESPTKSDTKK